jgi:hypothetical protein
MTEEPEMEMPVLVKVGMDCLRAIRAGEKYWILWSGLSESNRHLNLARFDLIV